MNTNPWNAALEEQTMKARDAEMRAGFQKDYDEQQAMLADSEGAERQDRQETARRQLMIRNLMGVIVKRSGGGPISPRLANWANGVLQGAGVKDGGIMAGGGFGKDGRFVIPTYGVDANGAQVPGQGIAYDGKSLFAMMNQLRGIFNDDDISRGAELLRKSGIGEKEIASLSYNPFAAMLSERDKQRRAMTSHRTGDPDFIGNRMGGGAGGREIGGTRPFKRPVAERHGVHAFASDGMGGFTRSDWTPEGGEVARDFGTRDPNYKGRWKVIESNADGKRYINDKTGEEQFVKTGDTLPWLKQSPTGKGRSAEDQIAIDAAKHGNKMEELRLQEEGKTTRSAAKRDFDQKKLDATIKKWGDDLKIREKSAKTAEDKAALEKSRAQYNDFSRRIGVLSNLLNSPHMPEEVKKTIRQTIAMAVNDDGTPNYDALADDDTQAEAKPGDNSGEKTVTGYRYNKDRTKRIPVYSDGSQGEVEDAK